MRLYLLRHGITEANERRLCYGSTDIPLCEKGRENLAFLRKTGIYPQAALYITSTLRRSSETLRILYDREPDILIEEFNEMNFGEFEMRSYDELKDVSEWKQWANGGSNATCPNGESLDGFMSRVADGLEKLAKLEADSAVVICHGGAIISIMNHLFPGQRGFYEWQPDCGRGYVIDIANGNAALLADI